MTDMNARERILKLFAGEETDRLPCFSGFGNVTTEGLKTLNQKFAASHLDAKMMAAAAASMNPCTIGVRIPAGWTELQRTAGFWRAP